MSTPVKNADRNITAERHVASLSRRAERLRADAARLSEPVAAAYRRRASELELEAFAYGVRHLPTTAQLGPLAA